MTVRPVRILGAFVVLLVVGAAGAFAIEVLRDGSPTAEAHELLGDDASFIRASDAGVTLQRTSELLARAAAECGTGRSCLDLRSASAFARVGGVTALRCSRPEIERFRTGLRAYVDDVDAGRPATPPNALVC